MLKYIHIRAVFLIIIIFFAVFPLAGLTDPTRDITIRTWKEYQVPVEGDVLLDLFVTVPAAHYIYLEHLNPPGFSILTEISLSAESGIVLKEVIKPQGVKKGDDLVLKGEGIFSLKIALPQGFKAGESLMLPFKVKVQMCAEKTGVCFLPYTFKKELKLHIVEPILKPISRLVYEKEIRWSASEAEGRGQAQKTGRNMFVLITAPSWCGPCQYLEATALQDEELIDVLNSHFIPVKIPDTIEGVRNPELWIYDFEGYPSYLVVTPAGEVLYQDAGTISAENLLAELERIQGRGGIRSR